MPSNDAKLADSIEEVGNFVAGFSRGSNETPPLLKSRILVKRDVKEYLLSQKGIGSTYFIGTAQFLPELQKAAAGNGSFMASASTDAVIRSTGLLFHNGEGLFPSLILEALRVKEGVGRAFIKILVSSI